MVGKKENQAEQQRRQQNPPMDMFFFDYCSFPHRQGPQISSSFPMNHAGKAVWRLFNRKPRAWAPCVSGLFLHCLGLKIRLSFHPGQTEHQAGACRHCHELQQGFGQCALTVELRQEVTTSEIDETSGGERCHQG